jgi:hypothetical protein
MFKFLKNLEIKEILKDLLILKLQVKFYFGKKKMNKDDPYNYIKN